MDVISLTIQLYRLKKTKFISERVKIAKMIASLDESENIEKEIEKIEKKFFEKQIEIYDIDLKIVEEEEKLLRIKLKELKGNEDEGDDDDDEFFEAFEEQPEYFEEDRVNAKINDVEKDLNWEVKKELSKKLIRLFRKRAWLRNKKVLFIFLVDLRKISYIFLRSRNSFLLSLFDL